MKKSLLLSLAVATALGASAESVVIVADGGQVFNPPTADQTIVIPIGWNCKNEGGYLTSNAGILNFVTPSSWACRNGAIRWGSGKVANLVATKGCKITKVTTCSQVGAVGSFGDSFTVDENNAVLQNFVSAEGVETVAMTAAAQNRLQWMYIEYTGTPTQTLPAVFESMQLAYPAGSTVKCVSATPGAKIYYTLDGTTPTTESTEAVNGVITLNQTAIVKTIAVADGMEASNMYQQPFVTVTAGTEIAFINFVDNKTIQYETADGVKTGTDENASQWEGDATNRWWNIGPSVGGAESVQNLPLVNFVNKDASINFYGGKAGSDAVARYYCSHTFGGNYQLRQYQNGTATATVKEGFEITDLVFNGADVSNENVGYMEWDATLETPKYVAKGTENGKLAVVGGTTVYSGWNWQLKAVDADDQPISTNKVYFYSSNSNTVYLDQFYIAYRATAGVDNVAADDIQGEAVYYNLQGVKIENPTHGLYIKVQGNKATKVIL